MKDDKKALWIIMSILLVIVISSVIKSLFSDTIKDFNYDGIFRL